MYIPKIYPYNYLHPGQDVRSAFGKKKKVPNSHRRFPILPNRDPKCILVVVEKGDTLYHICQILHPVLGMVRMAQNVNGCAIQI